MPVTKPISTRKRITDYLLAQLGEPNQPGAVATPDYLGTVNFDKNRSIPVSPEVLPLVSVYFIDTTPTPAGQDKRKPVLLTNQFMVEARVIVEGNDDDADPFDCWVHQQIVSADRCIVDIDGTPTQLALGIEAGRTEFGPVEGTQARVTEHKLQFMISHTTNPTDLSKVK